MNSKSRNIRESMKFGLNESTNLLRGLSLLLQHFPTLVDIIAVERTNHISRTLFPIPMTIQRCNCGSKVASFLHKLKLGKIVKNELCFFASIAMLRSNDYAGTNQKAVN